MLNFQFQKNKYFIFFISKPNPDSPLEGDIARELKINPKAFRAHAQEWTQKYARQ